MLHTLHDHGVKTENTRLDMLQTLCQAFQVFVSLSRIFDFRKSLIIIINVERIESSYSDGELLLTLNSYPYVLFLSTIIIITLLNDTL